MTTKEAEMASKRAEALKMDHLVPNTDELMQSVQDTVQPEEAQPPAAPDTDPRDNEVWTFEFKWTDRRGTPFSGTFTNKILSIGEKQAVSVMKARLAGGMSYDAIDPDMRVVNEAVAHMAFSLETENRPTWAEDLRKVKDIALIIALYDKVSSHETRFFRYDQATSES